MVRLGEWVRTPYGPGFVVRFSHRIRDWNLWGCVVVDPILGELVLLDKRGPFAAILSEGRIVPVLLDDLNLAGTLGEQALEMLVKLTGGERDL